MRGMLAAVLAALAVAVPGAGGTTIPFTATLVAPTHTPVAGPRWWYSVRVRSLAGRPIVAAVTVQIVDPFGGVHTATYDGTKKLILRRPFFGTFRDYLEFPRESRGFKLTVRVAVLARGARRTIEYWIRAR